VNTVLPIVVDLKNKIIILLSKYTDLKNSNSLLEDGKLRLEARVEYLEEEIKKLRKRIEIVDLTKGISEQDSSSIGIARTRVNSLIREIDKCILLLND